MVDLGPHMVLQRCVIGRWKGYRTASFVALLEDGTSIAESSPFRARGGEPPARSDVTVAAYDALAAELVERGWQLDASADPTAWYAATFVREVEALPDEAEEQEAEEAEEADLVAAAPVRTPVPPPAVPVAPTPAPAPVPVATPAPAPVPVAQREERAAPAAVPARRRGARRPRIAAALGLAAAAGLAVFVGLGHGLRHAEHAAAQTAQTAKPAQPPRAVAVQRVATRNAAPPARRAIAGVARAEQGAPAIRLVHLVVSAPVRPSWLEVHLGSAHGRILFAGELPVGQTLRLHGPRLWVRFGAAGNLAITSDGTPVRLQGTLEHIFVPRL